jgi:hypothetical protein
MRKGLIRISVLWVTLPLLLPMTASAQGTPEQQGKDDKQSASSAVKQGGSNATAEKKPSQAPVELRLKPVSTADAARSAAQELAKSKKGAGQEARTEQARAGKSAVEKTDESPVDEFRPAPNGNPEAEGVVVKSEGSKKSVLKSVHGAAYGALDAKNRKDHDGAASVGASSKSGKTSVYVETENSRTSAPSH